MALSLRNFVIDRVRRGVMFHSSTGEVLFSINQISNPSLSVTSETQDAVDALGARIMQFDRSKSAEFSGENSLFDMGLLATQSGKTLEYASTQSFDCPYMDEIVYASGNSITLTHTPVADSLTFAYVLNGDGTFGTKYTKAETAAAGKFSLSGKVMSFASGALTAGQKIWVYYEFAAGGAGEDAVRVTNTGVDFPKAGKFVMEVLGVDICDPSTIYAAYVVFPNAKLTSDFDISFATDSTHPFTIQAMQNYCDDEKKLFYLVIPEVQAAA